MKLLIAFILISFIFFAGCKKNPENNCTTLKEAMQTNDVAKAKSAITVFIKSLPSNLNTSQNLQNLAANISGSCSLTAKVFCFDCIYTNPAQSEIEITDNSVSPAISKTIDISYDSKDRMKFADMHD